MNLYPYLYKNDRNKSNLVPNWKNILAHKLSESCDGQKFPDYIYHEKVKLD